MVLTLIGLLVLVAMLLDAVFGNPSVIAGLLGLPAVGYRWLRRVRAVRMRRRRERRDRREAEQAWLRQHREDVRAQRRARKSQPASPKDPGTREATPAMDGPPGRPRVAAVDRATPQAAHAPWPLRSYRGHLPLPFPPCRGDLPTLARSSRPTVHR